MSHQCHEIHVNESSMSLVPLLVGHHCLRGRLRQERTVETRFNIPLAPLLWCFVTPKQDVEQILILRHVLPWVRLYRSSDPLLHSLGRHPNVRIHLAHQRVSYKRQRMPCPRGVAVCPPLPWREVWVRVWQVARVSEQEYDESSTSRCARQHALDSRGSLLPPREDH